jgi:GAF domain-containing protein
MPTLEMPVNEKERIESLRKYNILDTPPDGSFDRITRLASVIFKVPIALITLVDTHRIWFKSAYGLGISEINRDPGLCASAILSSDPYIIENAIEDPRTLANPLVAGEFGLRFYAAAPLQTEENHNLGTLCIIDKKARTFTQEEKELLKLMADIVMDEMHMRLSLRNAVHNIKTISGDITSHLKSTISKIEKIPDEKEKSQLLPYLDASRMFLINIENQLEQL